MAPIAMTLWCPMCSARHIDEGVWAERPHHTHSCQKCGLTWRPAVVHTVGVKFLPGFKNEVAMFSEVPSTERQNEPELCQCIDVDHNALFPERYW